MLHSSLQTILTLMTLIRSGSASVYVCNIRVFISCWYINPKVIVKTTELYERYRWNLIRLHRKLKVFSLRMCSYFQQFELMRLCAEKMYRKASHLLSTTLTKLIDELQLVLSHLCGLEQMN